VLSWQAHGGEFANFIVRSRIIVGSANDKVGGACKNYRGPGPNYVAYVSVFLGSIIIDRLQQLTLSDQAKVTLHLTVFQIQCKDF
jgi:hypothetical protein